MIVFPKQGNAYFPLPPDYPVLTAEGQRLARVNAVSLKGKPDLEVASWAFFREHYLWPTPEGMFYHQGRSASPAAHYNWIWDWYSHDLTVTAAPRGSAKSTLCKENILRKILGQPYWESLIFLAKQDFVTNFMEDLMTQIEHNERIVTDYGKLKPGRSQGIWNHSQLKLKNGSMVTGVPIRGASLGKRPSGDIYIDDVEKADDLVIAPSELIEAFKSFLFNCVFPMSRKGIPIRIIGTLLSRRTFIYWLSTTDDPRVRGRWKRLFYSIRMKQKDGTEVDFWTERMGPQFQADALADMGPAAYSTQFCNKPMTESLRMLQIHPELNTYWLLNQDETAFTNPMVSNAQVVTHQLSGWEQDERGVKTPQPVRLVRNWGKVVSEMRRFITVDYAETTTTTSDFSVVHVMGFENTPEHRDTLWSLDISMGRWPRERLIKEIYLLARKWNVSLIGVEQYPVQTEWAERIMNDLPLQFGENEVIPRMIPLKFPSKMDKAEKIKGLDWRFRHFRIKLPLDRAQTGPYRALWYQIENFTPDLGLLDHDDVIDTLAMHQAIGKPRASVGPDIVKPPDPIELLRRGQFAYDGSGVPVLSGVHVNKLPDDVIEAMLDAHREQVEENEYEFSDWISSAYYG